MKRDKTDPSVVELNEAEQVVHDWYMSLLNSGYGHHEAAERILNCVPIDGKTWDVLNNQEFRDWLAGYRPGTAPDPKELRASAGAQCCLVDDMVEQGLV